MTTESGRDIGPRESTYPLELVLLLILLAWSLYVFIEALKFDEFAAWGLPVIVSLPLIGLITIEFVSKIYQPVADFVDRFRLQESVNIEESERKSSGDEAIRFFISLLSFVVAATLFGLFFAIPIYLIVFSRLFNILNWTRTLIASIVIWLTISFVFGYFFNIYALRIPLFGLG